VTLLAKVPNLFVIHPDVPAKDFKEFVAHVKKNPGKLNYGSAGNASAGHLAMEYLKLVTGMFITHIPYRGTGPQLTDLLAGRTQACSAGLPALIPHIKSGKLRAIAVGTAQRLPMRCPTCRPWPRWATRTSRPRSGTASWRPRARRATSSSACRKSRSRR
jgi:tripartite-type tricarboxylate transporter receptor subunit TctC